VAGVMGAAARAQYGALTEMRSRILVNSLRTRRGKFELGASIFSSGFFLLIWLGAGAGDDGALEPHARRKTQLAVGHCIDDFIVCDGSTAVVDAAALPQTER